MIGLALSPWAKDRIGGNDLAALEQRCADMGVRVSTAYTTKQRHWTVRVRGHGKYVQLTGKGPVTAVICAALDDFEEQA